MSATVSCYSASLLVILCMQNVCCCWLPILLLDVMLIRPEMKLVVGVLCPECELSSMVTA